MHGWRLGIELFGPTIRYHVDRSRLRALDSKDFVEFVGTITDAAVRADTQVSVLANGDRFYPAELKAIRSATKTINLEAYEFLEGRVTSEFLEVLAERARSGVEVRVVVDAIGSWSTSRDYFRPLENAGGSVAWHHPVDLKSWPYLNHRSHRKLLITDGKIGFIGGAGFADHWWNATAKGPRWRDTVFRLEGRSVDGLNAVFAENWLEATGEVLAGSGQFPFPEERDGLRSLVVASTPGDGATRARILYQVLIEQARDVINITTPYFVPDRSARHALVRAVRNRGVKLRILTAGPHSDHPATRRLSRLLASGLAKAGAEIFEYQPAMIHAKLMSIDNLWTVAGSTNFDHRSFALNDEVNIATLDPEVASAVNEDFERDLRDSRQLTLQRLQDRHLAGRIIGRLSWVLRREQ